MKLERSSFVTRSSFPQLQNSLLQFQYPERYLTLIPTPDPPPCSHFSQDNTLAPNNAATHQQFSLFPYSSPSPSPSHSPRRPPSQARSEEEMKCLAIGNSIFRLGCWWIFPLKKKTERKRGKRENLCLQLTYFLFTFAG